MLRIGMVQLSVREGAVRENCEHIRELAGKYASDGIDLLCFPELCISGYDFEKARDSTGEKEFFSALAGEFKIAVLAGVSTVCEGKHYDAACLWDETGQLLGEYRKIHLWDRECEFFSRGEELLVIPFRGWKIGLLICADMRFFEVSTPLKNMGADILIYLNAWAAGWQDLFLLCARMRAAENQIYVASLNRASGDVSYCGCSCVMAPDGSVLEALADDREGYLKIEASHSLIHKVRESLPWEEMKLPHVYEKYDAYRYAAK